MKPVIVTTPKNLSSEDIKQLKSNGICVVVAKDPAAVKYYECPRINKPMDVAALDCFKELLAGKGHLSGFTDTFHTMLSKRLVKGTDLETK